MPLPIAGLVGKYLAGKALDASGASGVINDFKQQAGNAFTNATGIPYQVLDTKGFIKDKLTEAARNAPSVPGGGEEGGRGEGAFVGQDFNLRRRSFDEDGFKRGGKVKSKPKVSSASKRADGIAQRGKTRGRYL